MVRNGIPRICTERNSELCSLPQKSSEQNYGSLLLFLFHGTEFRVIFSSTEGFETEFRDFLFRRTTGIPSEITICYVYSVFRGIFFLSEIPNPTQASKYVNKHGSVANQWNQESNFAWEKDIFAGTFSYLPEIGAGGSSVSRVFQDRSSSDRFT